MIDHTTSIRSARLHLDDQNGRAWTGADRVHVRGFAHTQADMLLRDEALAHHLDVSPQAFVDRVERLNGEFAAVRIEEESGTVNAAAAVDILRTMPLFYGLGDDTLYVSDRAAWVAEHVAPRRPTPVLPEPAPTAEFMVQGSTTGPRTLYPGVWQLRAGEAFTVQNGAFALTRYFVYGDLHQEPPPSDPSGYQNRVEEGVATFESAFRRTLASVEDRPLAIPLSGGMDSRAVAAMAKRCGRDDVLCFSYGRPGNFEAERSRRVAEALGLRWTFVPYTPARWHRWYNSESYRRFQQRTIQGCNIEHEQDWPAVLTLLERGEVEPGTIFLPGHMGGFLARNHLSDAAFDPAAPQLDLHATVARKFFAYWPLGSLDAATLHAMRRHVGGTLHELNGREQLRAPLAERALKQYGWQERQAKVFVNSIRVYEHHGCDWRIPLWDRQLVDFWLSAPLEDRYDRCLFLDILQRVMNEEAFAIPSSPPERGRLSHLFHHFFDYDYGRLGAFVGPSRLRGLTTRVKDFVRVEHPVVQALTRTRRHLPLQRVPFNGILALVAVQDVYEELQRRER